MYTALYRTERPENFDQVLGQDHIVRILKNQIKTETVGHAYLFCGTRGTGKTSVARILAKAVNCTGEDEGLIEKGGGKPCCKCPNCLSIQKGNFLDVIEIDAASNNGVDNVRELRESVNYPPSIGKKKVYIIDEAHELTTHALNALLKTLEEPPENVIFILATTDPQKLIQTILSRCLRLDFRRITESDLKNHMAEICRKRGLDITEDALNLLASNADGSARDALSLLDQCLSAAEKVLDRETVLEYLGTVSDEFYIKLTNFVAAGDISGGLLLLDDALRDGKDVKQILSGWVGHYRALLISKHVKNPEDMLNLSRENVERIVDQAKAFSLDDINNSILTLAETVNNARYSTQPRVLMELAIATLGAASGKGSVKPKPQAPVVTISEKPVAPIEEAHITPNFVEEKPAMHDPVPAPVIDDMDDYQEIWSMIWDRIDDPGSVTMVRINSTLAGISESEFKLLVSGDFAINIAEKYRKKLEAAASDVVGRPLKMILKKTEKEAPGVQESFFTNQEEINREEDNIWDEDSGNQDSDIQNDDTLKKNIEDLLNIEVRIEE